MEFNFKKWSMMEPMMYYDNATPTSEALRQKRQNMLDNFNNEYIASQKWDGEWGMFIKGNDNEILIRSRSLSKVTGVYGDKTAHLPHMVEEMKAWPNNTVVLAEICWPQLGKMSTDVGSILRCLPDRAVKRQEDDQWLVARVFDVLCWDGNDYLADEVGYGERIKKCAEIFPQDSNSIFTITNVYEDNFAEHADEIIAAGGEGIVIQRKDFEYSPGKRSAWKTLKVKQKLPVMELPIIGFIPANKEYAGKDADGWSFWEGTYDDGQKVLINHAPNAIDFESGLSWTPVSKPYYYGWMMGVQCEFNCNVVNVSSGLDDEDREWLASSEAKALLEKGQLYAEVKAMCVATLGGLRHPVIQRIRIMDDKMTEVN